MKQFFAFIKKEFYHIFRDRRTMLILLGMPVVEIILFGFAISTEVKNVRLAVLDHACHTNYPVRLCYFYRSQKHPDAYSGSQL